MAISDSTWEALGALTLLLALCSAVADVFVIYRVLKAPDQTASRRHVVLVSCADLVGAIGFAIGATTRLSDGADMSTGSMCTMHGALIHAADLAAVFWTLSLTHGILLMVSGGEKKAQAAIRYQHVAVWSSVLLLTVLAVGGVGGVEFKPELVWCSVGARPRAGPLVLFYAWILVAHAGMVFFCLLAKNKILATAKSAGGVHDSLAKAVRTFVAFPTACHLVWTPSYMLAVQLLVDAHEPVLFFVLISALFRPAKGLIMLVLCRKMVGLGGKTKTNKIRVYSTNTTATGNGPVSSTLSTNESEDGSSPAPAVPRSPKKRTDSRNMTAEAIKNNNSMARSSFVPTVAAMTTVGLAVFLLCLGMATSSVAYSTRYSRVALNEARSTTVASAVTSANSQVATFLAGPSQIKATLDYNAASVTQWDLEDRTVWETLLAPYFMSNPALLAIYSATSKRQVIKVHRETEDHLCTQLRVWTPVTGEYENTTRTDLCRPDVAGDYWGSADYWDPVNEEYIEPSYTKIKYYDPFAKGWYLQANESDSADTIYWNGPVFQSYSSEGLTQLDPVLEMVFRVEWNNLPPNNYTYDGPLMQRSNHKFKVATNALNSLMASLEVGAGGAVYIANEIGEVVAAPDIEQQLHTDDEDVISFYKIWELGGPLAWLEIGADETMPTELLVGDDEYELQVQSLELVPEWRLVVLSRDADFLKDSTALYDDMQVFALLGTLTVLGLMWKAFFDLHLEKA